MTVRAGDWWKEPRFQFFNTGPYHTAQAQFDTTDTPVVFNMGMPAMKVPSLAISRAILLLAIPGTSLAAQAIPYGPRPTASDCHAAAKAVASPRSDASNWERLPDCGSAGATALASALRNARTSVDANYLGALYAAMSDIRAASIFETALDVMLDPAASGPARATAFLIAIAQHDRGLTPRIGISFADLVNGHAGTTCPLAPASDMTGFRSEQPLPAGYEQRLAHATASVEKAVSATSAMKSIALCSRATLSRRRP